MGLVIAPRWLWTALIVLATGAPSSTAMAQKADAPSKADKNRAAELVYQGDDQRKAGDHQAALEAYRQADELMGVPTTGIEVARELAALGRLVDARAKCADIAKYPERPGEPRAFANARVQARQLAAKVDQRLPKLRVRISGSEGAAVQIDGRPVPSIDEPLRLDPGEHEIVASAGAATATATITVAEGEDQEIDLLLETPQDDPPEEGVPSESAGLSPWVWVGFGVGGAGLLAGTITGIMALQTTGVLSDECADYVCPSEYEADVDKGVILSHVSTVSFAVGIAGVGVGVVLLVLELSNDDEAPPPGDDETVAGTTIQPLAGPGFVGIGGAF